MNERDIQNLPIVETVLLSFKNFPDHKLVKILSCSVLITFARFRKIHLVLLKIEKCIDEAKKLGIIEMMSKWIQKEEDSKVVSLELAVMSAFGINGLTY